ncbi:Metallo-dependent phosphatase-like protein [Lipomyces oligophaga]|uniref:Metallo-dependent phosphatase-like protein n=1 Tax=Lipomyces oligophaga TaxID=45792 RepID=UPI0034CF1DC2
MDVRILALCKRLLRSRTLIVSFFCLLLVILLNRQSDNFERLTFASRAIGGSLLGTFHSRPQQQYDDVAQLPDVLIKNIQIRSCTRLFKGACDLRGFLKVPKDLNLESSWFRRSYVYFEPISRSQVEPGDKVVVDLFIGNAPKEVIPTKVPSRKLDARAMQNVEADTGSVGRWVKRSKNFWIKLGSPSDFSVSALDVLYGPDAVDPRLGWALKGDSQNSLVPGAISHPRLTIRYGGRQDLPSVELVFNNESKFKILQVADLHFSTGVGKCLDVYPELPEGANCEADPRTLEFLNRVLDEEKPDLAVLTGDQVFGDAAPDAQTALLKAVAPFIDRHIPFAMTFGNHDDEGDLSRQELMTIAENLPFSLSSSGPEFARGIGNYYQIVKTSAESATKIVDMSKEIGMAIYFLDTHKYSPNPRKMPGYDWLDKTQLHFLRAAYEQITLRGRRRTNRASPQQQQEQQQEQEEQDYDYISEAIKPPLSMAFFHIPLTEYRNQSNQFVGSYAEPCTGPKYNSGARSVLSELGVSVVSVGHDHVNDFCMYDTNYAPTIADKAIHEPDRSASMDKDTNKLQRRTSQDHPIWLCHGGAIGLGGYAGYGGFIRRVRVFEIDRSKNSITSYKRLENGPQVNEKLDFQVLVDQGVVVH